jgi:Sugar (and other) transporter
MLKIVYWQKSLPAHQQTAINLATLVGTIIGQLTFGILADRYGRKRMYGYELIIVIVATVGLALCSKGAQSSVNILAWIISWRLLMGIGIGAGCPLSAVIVSEYVNCKELIHWSCQPYRLLFAHMHIRNPNQLPLFVHCKSLVVGLLDSSCSYLSQLRRAEMAAEMAAEQWNEMLLQKLVRTLIWERHGHSNGFQKQEEKETV